MVRFHCKNCGQKLKVGDVHSGRSVKCPKCAAAAIVPGKPPSIKFLCDHCGQKINVPLIHAGRKAKCPGCSGRITVPQSGSVSTVDGPAASAVKRSSAAQDTVRFLCSVCSRTAEVPLTSRGKIVECPACGAFTEVSQGEDAGNACSPKRGRDGIAGVSAGPVSDAGASPAGGLGTVACPSCHGQPPEGAKICIACGVYIRSGRPILTARGIDEDTLYDRSHRVVSPVSWVIPFGLYPVYSEVMGRHKPYATWAIAIVTIVVSFWFLGLEWSQSPQLRSAKNLMLWTGKAQPDAEHIGVLYEYTCYGDEEAFYAKREELAETVPADELDRAALAELTPQERCFGQYSHTQLISHAFLHGGILHLAGNMLFLLIFCSRVNSVIGNILTLILYPVLGIGAAFAHMQASVGGPPTPMLGASGAVMGTAGVYLLLFPVHRVYLAAWARWGLLAGFHLSFKVFSLRGFWVVLFYIMFDVVAVSFVLESTTAHWAHIGGMLFGLAAGLILLVTRIAHSRSDMLSSILGKYAWPLIGSPHSHNKSDAPLLNVRQTQ